jgi:hypothetical protein
LEVSIERVKDKEGRSAGLGLKENPCDFQALQGKQIFSFLSPTLAPLNKIEERRDIPMD